MTVSEMPKLALLAGGIATRLKPVTEKIPKSMLLVAGKPFIHHQLNLLQGKGIRNVVVCTGHLGEQIRNYVKDGAQYGLKVEYSFDGEKLLGTGGALKKALPILGNYFWIMYGDSYLDISFKEILDYFTANHKSGLMTVFKNDNQWDNSNIVFDGGHIIQYDKAIKIKEMKYIDYGLSILRKEVFDSIPEGEVVDLADIFKKVIKDGDMLGFEVTKRFYEIGSFKGMEETDRYIKSLSF